MRVASPPMASTKSEMVWRVVTTASTRVAGFNIRLPRSSLAELQHRPANGVHFDFSDVVGDVVQDKLITMPWSRVCVRETHEEMHHGHTPRATGEKIFHQWWRGNDTGNG